MPCLASRTGMCRGDPGALAGMRAMWTDMPLLAAARQKGICERKTKKLRNPELFDKGAAIVSRRAHRAQSALAERTGLEPATPGVTGRYSNQLNYRSAAVCKTSVLQLRCQGSLPEYWRPLGDSNPCTHRERVMS